MRRACGGSAGANVAGTGNMAGGAGAVAAGGGNDSGVAGASSMAGTSAGGAGGSGAAGGGNAGSSGTGGSAGGGSAKAACPPGAIFCADFEEASGPPMGATLQAPDETGGGATFATLMALDTMSPY
ncbi:MAG: hypothetical protein ABI548_10270, partial [Polyangiaceae bacterium]